MRNRTEEPMRVIGYIRASTADQRLTPDAQRHQLDGECDRRGWVLVEIVQDNGVSGSVPFDDRQGGNHALSLLADGAADVLMATRLDRLSRSVPDFVALMDLSQRDGFALVVSDMDIDTTTPNGRLVATLLSAVAQWEREMIAARTAEALAVKKAQGFRLGRPVALPEEVRARIGVEREAGETLQAIADGLNRDGIPLAQGGSQWRHSTVSAVLRSLATDAETKALREAAA